jgi:hypothetical protein
MSIFINFFHVKQAPILSLLGFGGGGSGLSQGGAGAASTLTIKMWGAAGGGWVTKGWGSPTPGSAGGAVSVTDSPYEDLGISSGDTLYIYVGGGTGNNSGGSNGGHPGSGGSGAGPGTGGGGMTSIYANGPYSSGTRMLIAGGSGGSAVMAAFGWYPTGYPNPSTNNVSSPPFPAPNGPGGGTQTFGGSGSIHPSYPDGSPGSQFSGGNSSPTPNGAGGGGGAGWYGGGGGHGDTGAANGSGGSGGSNYQNPSISATVTHHNDFQDIPNYLGAGPNTGWDFSSNPWPSFWPTFYPTIGPASSTPGFNSGDPDYSFPRCGGSLDGPGNGSPGSVVIIDVDGNKTTFTHTGSVQTYSVP